MLIAITEIIETEFKEQLHLGLKKQTHSAPIRNVFSYIAAGKSNPRRLFSFQSKA
jgi:hypothetical protein